MWCGVPQLKSTLAIYILATGNVRKSENAYALISALLAGCFELHLGVGVTRADFQRGGVVIYSSVVVAFSCIRIAAIVQCFLAIGLNLERGSVICDRSVIVAAIGIRNAAIA